MKKNDNNIKPVMFENLEVNLDELAEIKYRCTKNKAFV